MYLSALDAQKKDLFLSFAYCIAAADGYFQPEEMELIKSYCEEMSIDFDIRKIEKDIDVLLKNINSVCSDTEKRIFIFEGIGLAMVDNDFDESERKLMAGAINALDVEKGFDSECESLIKEYLSVQNRINGAIFKLS